MMTWNNYSELWWLSFFLDNYDDLDFIRIYIFWIQTTVSDRSPFIVATVSGTRAKLGSESQGYGGRTT